jgi:hypothetical protein
MQKFNFGALGLCLPLQDRQGRLFVVDDIRRMAYVILVRNGLTLCHSGYYRKRPIEQKEQKI